MTNKQIAGIGIGIAVIVFVGFVFMKNGQPNTTPPTDTTTETTNTELSNDQIPTVNTPTSGTYTLAEVAAHDNQNDCWTVIDGNVYNLTEYVSRHDGGGEILRACGIDGSTLFNQRETADGQGVGSGTPHSNSAKTQLQRLQIGSLAQ